MSAGPHLATALCRRPAVMEGIDIETARGLEIGALDSPMVPPDLADIRFADVTRPQHSKYRQEAGTDAARMVEPHYIWSGHAGLKDIVQGTQFDYVVGSHVIEHVPDLLTWLLELAGVLAVGGEIRLVVPDRRFTFDVLRAETRVSEVLEAWLQQRRVPLPRAMLDMLVNEVPVDATQIWRDGPPALERRPVRDPAHLIATAREMLAERLYFDVHAWVFTPRSFAQLMADLVEFEVLDLSCSLFHDTEPGTYDFIVGLRPADRQTALQSWLDVRDRTAAAPWEPRP